MLAVPGRAVTRERRTSDPRPVSSRGINSLASQRASHSPGYCPCLALRSSQAPSLLEEAPSPHSTLTPVTPSPGYGETVCLQRQEPRASAPRTRPFSHQGW